MEFQTSVVRGETIQVGRPANDDGCGETRSLFEGIETDMNSIDGNDPRRHIDSVYESSKKP